MRAVRVAADTPAAPVSGAPAVTTPAPLGEAPALTVPSTPDAGTTGTTETPQAPALTGKIAKITISGNKNISSDAIMAVMSEKVGDEYSQTSAENDREAIRDMGYFNGEVGLTATQDAAGGIDLTYSVTENPVVKKIVFTANTPSGVPSIPVDDLKAHMDTKEGQVLNANVFKRDLEKLFDRQTGYAREKGYIIDPSPDLNLDPETDVLTIPLIEAHIDHIVIKGNKKTKTVVITREMHSEPGQVLNELALQKDLTNIYNLGLFEQVGPFEETPTDIGKVDITIPVVEKRSGQVSVGVGYSSRSKLVGRAELAENNFRGMGERVSVMWEVDGVDTGNSVDLSFFEPYIDKHHTSLDLDVFDRAVYRFSSDTFAGTVGNNNIYIEQHKGAALGLHRPLSDTLSAGLSLRTETISVNNVQLPPQDLFIRQQGPVSALGFQLSQNTRDNNFSPASGGLRSVSIEFGTSDTTTVNNTPGPLIPGRHNFTKFGMDLRQYISLQGPRKAGDFREPKKVFAVRALVGFTNKQVPFFEQYFLGGPESLRSLQIDQYWGNNLALVQAELRIPIGKDNNLQGVLFSDAGDAWGSIYQDNQLKQHTNFKPSTDVGVGVRLVTPVGPIRLDYAVGSGGGRTQFDIGQSF
jgi:outer membrane protein insertion porin family